MENTSDTVEDVMKRVEALEGTKEGNFLVKGTILVDGEEIIRTSFDSTTSTGLAQYMEELKVSCENFVREVDSADKLQFVRAYFKDRHIRDSHEQIMMAVEDDFKAVVVQEYKARDLRVRSVREQKDTRGYKYVQKDFFFPSLDK